MKELLEATKKLQYDIDKYISDLLNSRKKHDNIYEYYT